MKWTLVALILCSLAALGWTKPCCTPDKWSGDMDVYETNGGLRKPMEASQMHYEYTNKRFVSLITKFNESETPGFHQFKMLARYDDNVGMQYLLDLRTGKCVKKQITEFYQFCTPPYNGTLFDQYLGVRGGSRVIQRDYTTTKQARMLLVQPVDEDYTGHHCYPVLDVREGRGEKSGDLLTVIYKYFETGIRHKGVFDVPKECLDAQKVNQLPFDYERLRTVFRG